MKTKTKKTTLKIFKSHSASLRGGEGHIKSHNFLVTFDGYISGLIGNGYFYSKVLILKVLFFLVRFDDFRMQYRMDW